MSLKNENTKENLCEYLWACECVYTGTIYSILSSTMSIDDVNLTKFSYVLSCAGWRIMVTMDIITLINEQLNLEFQPDFSVQLTIHL